MKTKRHIDVICDECYQEFSLTPHDQKNIAEYGHIHCKHCSTMVTFEDTISHKLKSFALLSFYLINTITILTIMLSHLVMENGYPATYALASVGLYIIVMMAMKGNPSKLVSIMKERDTVF
ncbi:hypothetical protein F9817_19470 [Vibrio sp. CAIM 722]|uniref:Uncharacterized protein n=1 Tax=Vibrio eleionomae TaxID=2653505 RepID=A0A7X4LNR8_9VIBR|nr:hypothetical protein [Vibrio eleionomae]MZI95358.1 hypothetical protein [Vibrio eleionomae]